MDKITQAKKVVGLKYEREQGVPQVVVKGIGPASTEILRRREALGGPPVVENAALADQLYKLPMDAHIGPELFELVAMLLAHIVRLEHQANGDLP